MCQIFNVFDYKYDLMALLDKWCLFCMQSEIRFRKLNPNRPNQTYFIKNKCAEEKLPRPLICRWFDKSHTNKKGFGKLLVEKFIILFKYW